jgi:small subunit ribosomal protein S24e
LIYDSVDSRKKYDQKRLLKRDKLWDKAKGPTRKQLKEIKGRVKKVRGTAKAKAAASSGKKKK